MGRKVLVWVLVVAAIVVAGYLAYNAGYFVGSDGNPGYFQQQYWVYGRAGQPCRKCGTNIEQIRQGQRSSFYCPRCQK